MLPTAPLQTVLEPSADALFELAESIWTALLELEVQRLDARATGVLAGDEMLTACVRLHGDWQGAVALTCPQSLARRVAAAMFNTASETATDAELQDTIGELTHVLGGNLKSLLPAPCHLSPPLAMESYNILNEGQRVEQILLSCEGQPLQITLFKRENTA